MLLEFLAVTAYESQWINQKHSKCQESKNQEHNQQLNNYRYNIHIQFNLLIDIAYL